MVQGGVTVSLVWLVSASSVESPAERVACGAFSVCVDEVSEEVVVFGDVPEEVDDVASELSVK